MIADMIAEGASSEMILVAVRAVERQQEDALERRRSADRVRQERHRNASRDITLGNVSHAPSRSHAGAEDRTSKTQLEPQGKKGTGRADLEGFKAELSPDVDAERLDALVKHRRSKKGQITAHAARLFRRDAKACGLSLADAIDTCISRNWITVKAEWLEGQPARAGPTPRVNPTLQAARSLMDEIDAAPSEIEGHHPPPRLVAIGQR